MPESRTQSVLIDQALHGYRQGHRLLSTSTSFDPESESQLLALSDLLTSEPLSATGSYLSGYPLKSANKYVLARTWLAEGARPGSVWTHSLVLDYASLSALDDVMPLLSLFQRPSGANDSAAYAVRLSVRPTRNGVTDSYVPGVAGDPRVPLILRHLYGHSAVNRFAIPASDPVFDELLAMALWRQMWPGLRRDFAFFSKGTSALAEVMAGSALCFSSDPALYSSFLSRGQGAEQYELDGFARLQRDLPRRGPTRLRRFLGRYAYDAAKPRAAVPALATLFAERKKPLDALVSFERLLGAYPGIDRLKRALLLVCIGDGKDKESVVRALELFANEPAFVSAQALEDALQKSPMVVPNAPRLLAAVADSSGETIGHQAFAALARQLPLDVLADQATAATRQRLLKLRSEIAGRPAFWSVDDGERIDLAHQAISSGIGGAVLLEGMGPRLSSKEVRLVLSYDPTLAVPLCRMIGSGRAPLDAANGLDAVPDILKQLANSNLTVAWEVLDRVAESLVHAGRVGEAGDWWALSKRLPHAPAVSQQYVLGQLFLAGLDSRRDEHLSLCETAFDPLWTVSDQYPGLSRELTALLSARPMTRQEAFYPELLLSTAWARYRRSASSCVMALSANTSRLGRLARFIRHSDGEEALRKVALQIRSSQSRLRLPVSIVEAALDDAMPFFSPKLPRGPKR